MLRWFAVWRTKTGSARLELLTTWNLSRESQHAGGSTKKGDSLRPTRPGEWVQQKRDSGRLQELGG